MDKAIANRIFSLFVGLEESFVHRKDQYNYNQCEEGYRVPGQINPSPNEIDSDHEAWSVYDMKFDSSWDWMMLVLKKIQSIEVNKLGEKIDDVSLMIGMKKIVLDEVSKLDLPMVYMKAFEFVKLYDELTGGDISKIIENKKKLGLID